MGQAYCIRCKAKQDLIEGTLKYASNGVPMEKGKCKVCSCTVQRFLNKEERAKITSGQATNTGKTTKEEVTRTEELTEQGDELNA